MAVTPNRNHEWLVDVRQEKVVGNRVAAHADAVVYDVAYKEAVQLGALSFRSNDLRSMLSQAFEVIRNFA